MILVELCKLVVQENGGLEIRREVEKDAAMILLAHWGRSVVGKGPLRGRRGETSVGGSKVIGKLGNIGKGCRSLGITVGVVDCELGDLVASPYQKASDGGKEEPNNKERREDCPWCEDRLPCLETLLLESGVWRSRSDSGHRKKGPVHSLAGLFHAPFALFASAVAPSSLAAFFRLKSAIDYGMGVRVVEVWAMPNSGNFRVGEIHLENYNF